MRRIAAALSMSLAVVAAIAPSHAAVNTVVAPPGGFAAGFAPGPVFVVSSEDATFVNLDPVGHNVESVAFGPDSNPWCDRYRQDECPLFRTPEIGGGTTAVIDGVQLLPLGDYPFVCTLHPSTMRGTITVIA